MPRSLRTPFLACLLLAAGACASSTAYVAPPIDHPPPPPQHDPVMPAHRFEARPHTPRNHPTRVTPPLSSLPAMVKSSKCVAAGAVPEAKPTTTPPPTKVARPRTAPKADSGASRAPSSPGAAQQTAPSAAPADDEASRFAGAPAADVAQPSGSPTAPKSRAERRRDKRSSQNEALAASEPAPNAPPTESIAAEPEPELEPVMPPPGEGWGEPVYLSNDDTMSLSSAQRVTFAIDTFQPIPPQHVRPHEFLNYFSFETAPVERGHDFSIRAEIAPSSQDPSLYSLALSIAGRPVGREGRRNAALTLVIDRSGSMRAEGRMDFLKRGLLRMIRELEPGDIVNVVTFDHRVCAPLQNFVVGRDDLDVLTKTIHAIRPSGATNLHAGLTRGYELADRAYQPQYTNRVLLVTDALANRGDTDPRTLAMVSDWYDSRRIRLSGIGVGKDFNDALLDRLTEKGRGAYVFLGTEAEVEAVFGDRFVSLIETTANDVHFRLHLPPSLRMQVFHGEEASTFQEDVQAVHFFADTSVLLLSELEAWQDRLRPEDDIMLEIDYQDPETGEPRSEDFVFTIGDLTEENRNVRKAELVMHFINGIARMAHRGAPAVWQPRPGTWQDAQALADCQRTRADFQAFQVDHRDPEVQRVVSLWDTFCSRFEGPGGPRPPRKDARQSWPGSTPRRSPNAEIP